MNTSISNANSSMAAAHNKFTKTISAVVKYRVLLLMLLPAIIYYIVFRYAPLYGILIAFKDYKFRLGIMGSPWIGFDNFSRLFASQDFWKVLRNTVLLSSYKLLFGFPAPIIFAILLNEVRNIHYKKVIQTVSYLPHFLSWVILAGIIMKFLSPSEGPVNYIIMELGGQPIHFLANNSWFRAVLVSTSVWKGIGWESIIYLAALCSIDTQLYDSAVIDGCGRFKSAIYITLPSLAPVITIMFILSVGSIINDDFDQVFNLYNEAVYDVGDVLSTYTYRIGLQQMQYGFSTAVGLFQNAIAFVLVLITNKITKSFSDYCIW